jgi:hypothetical protein
MEYKNLKSIFFLLLILSGCDWFSPRTPEQPWDEESRWQEPISPSITILNLKNAFEDRNIINYTNSLSTEFQFLGDPADSPSVPPGSFIDWSRDVEIEVTTKIFNTFGVSIEVYLEDSLKDSTGTDATFYEVYNINLESLDSTITTTGIAQFSLELGSDNLWSIVEWSDFRIDTVFIDWGILKARLR